MLPGIAIVEEELGREYITYALSLGFCLPLSRANLSPKQFIYLCLSIRSAAATTITTTTTATIMYVVATLITYVSDDHIMIYMLIKSHWRTHQLLRATPLSQRFAACGHKTKDLGDKLGYTTLTNRDKQTNTLRLITQRCVKCG